MPPGLHGKNLNGLSEFKSHPLRQILRGENPDNLVAEFSFEKYFVSQDLTLSS